MFQQHKLNQLNILQTDVQEIQRWITGTTPTEVFNNLRSEHLGSSTTTTPFISIVKCWPVIETPPTPGK